MDVFEAVDSRIACRWFLDRPWSVHGWWWLLGLRWSVRPLKQ